MDTPTATTPKVTIDRDLRSACLQLDPAEDYTGIDQEAIISAISDAKVDITDEVKARAERFCEQLEADSLSDKEFIIAEAQLPKPAVDAQFELVESLLETSDTPPEDDEGDDSIDYYAQCRLVTVETDTAIGVITPAQPAVHGKDVLGQKIPAKGTPRELKLTEGVRLDDDGKTVYSTTKGLVRVENNQISVVDLIEIDGDVDFDSGCIDVDSDVIIKGTVRDLFNVTSTCAISIGGAIESTQVQAGKDVVVRGGIAGKEKGEVQVGGQLVCKYCDAATVRAEGDITITKEAIASHLHANGQLIIPRGALIGGTAHARGGAQIKELGSEAEITTYLTIGLDPIIIARAVKIDQDVEKRRRSAEKIRSAVAPLIANIKRLTSSQREQATELMFQADTIQTSCDELIAEKDKSIQEGCWDEEPILIILDRIFPGVRLIFEDLELVVREVIRGPVKIFKRRAGDGVPTALVCVNTASGSRRELMCQKYTAEPPSEDEKDETA